MVYQHGIRVRETETSVITPVEGTAGLQVVFGIAPVNLVDNPAINEPVIAYSYEEAVAQLGYSENFKDYTLCQSMYASFQMFGVAPVIFVNVLNPAKHKTENEEITVEVSDMQAVVPIFGILKNSVNITADETALSEGKDYVLSFDSEGYLVVTLAVGGVGEGAKLLKVKSNSIDPSKVTAADIVGGYDVTTGEETGLETIRKVYPKFGITPGILLAPGWSQNPDIGVVMAAKCEEINGVFTCECLLDLDSSSADQYTKCQELKNDCGYTSKHAVVLWPEVMVGSRQLKYSAVFGALVAYIDAQNDDVPSLYASNKTMAITGTVLEKGKEVTLDQVQANVLNGQGIVTAINVGGWRAWGNNMACYPTNQDPKDRWFGCRRFFSWWGNSFILTYFNKVDDPADYRLVEAIVDSENIRGNSYTAQGKCAGARMEYLASENPVEDILEGKIQFHMYLAPYTPAEDILCTLEFDPSMLEAALGGE